MTIPEFLMAKKSPTYTYKPAPLPAPDPPRPSHLAELFHGPLDGWRMPTPPGEWIELPWPFADPKVMGPLPGGFQTLEPSRSGKHLYRRLSGPSEAGMVAYVYSGVAT